MVLEELYGHGNAESRIVERMMETETEDLFGFFCAEFITSYQVHFFHDDEDEDKHYLLKRLPDRLPLTLYLSCLKTFFATAYGDDKTLYKDGLVLDTLSPSLYLVILVYWPLLPLSRKQSLTTVDVGVTGHGDEITV